MSEAITASSQEARRIEAQRLLGLEVTDWQRALLYEADVIEAQSQDVKALSRGRRLHLARCAKRLRRLAGGDYPYIRVSYGPGVRAGDDADL